MFDVLAFVILFSAPLMGTWLIDPQALDWARDRWLMGMVAIGLVVLAFQEPMLAAAGLAVLAWWRTQRTLPSVATWAGASGLWFLARSMSPVGRRLAVLALLWLAVLQTALVVVQWRTGQPPMGTFGHRTYAGAFFALLLPAAVGTHWALALAVGVGLLVSCSWVAWIAAAVALAWLEPWTAFVTGAAATLLAVLCWPQWAAPRGKVVGADWWPDRWLGVRGASLDGLRARLVAWIGLCGSLTPRGHGPGSTSRALRGLHVRSGYIGIHGGHAHNEVLQYLYEYGLLGGLAIALVAWRILPSLRLGDPLSAMVVAGVVLLLGTACLRTPAVAVPWWALAAWVAR